MVLNTSLLLKQIMSQYAVACNKYQDNVIISNKTVADKDLIIPFCNAITKVRTTICYEYLKLCVTQKSRCKKKFFVLVEY